MPALNFTLQDILGTCLAFLLFPILMVFPGYVIAWTLDLFDFKRRLPLTQFVIAIVISLAVSPILVYLLYRLVSATFTLLILAIFAVTFGAIVINQLIKSKPTWKYLQNIGRYPTLGILIALGWIIFAIVSLVDIQWNNKLYYSVVSYDFTTRVAVIAAITRTGVPPINPSYFPGHPEYLTFLYYFWYILCSIIDQLGGNLVDARMAMIASVAWCGLGLMATIALYLRLRNPTSGIQAWKSALVGISFLSISGLDAIPAITNMVTTRLTQGYMWPAGDIEHWNEQITAWVGSIFWIPHHIASMIACLTAILLLQSIRGKKPTYQIAVMVIIGLAFASAVGLSTWITFVFAIFWVLWMIIIFVREKESKLSSVMLFAGVVAVLAASPFLVGLLQGGSGSGSGGFPIAIEVRRFDPIIPYVGSLAPLPQNIIYFLLLPINYLMELGFFFIIGLLWLRQHDNFKKLNNPFYISEIILLFVIIFVGSFIRSTTISSVNDLGWRSWLFGQFVLLIWAIEIIEQLLAKHSLRLYFVFFSRLETIKTGRLLIILIILGFFTTVVDVALLRTWPLFVENTTAGFPNGMSPDTQLGNRAFAARLAYNYIQDNLPENVIVQHNPANGLDRPAGLYGSRQMIIAPHTAYGVPQDQYKFLVKQIGQIFLLKNVKTWDSIDEICDQYFLDVLIINDVDPIWSSLTDLEKKRKPLYQNQYYAILACGSSAIILQPTRKI